MNLFLSFIKEYNETQEGMNLFVAFGAVVFYVGALIFGLNVIGNTAAILVGNGIGFCTGFAHYKTNLRNKELQKRINDMNFEELISANDEDSSQNRVNDGIDNSRSGKLNAAYLRLKLDGGARMVNNITKDEAGNLLLEVCASMPYAPAPHMLRGLYIISVEDLDDEPAIVYSFKSSAGSIAQLVYIFLIRTKNSKLRLFTVETSFPFALCEYLDGNHMNYGQLNDLKDVPKRIKAVLKGNNG